MRAAPPLAFTVSRFGVWRAALGALALAAAASMLAWWKVGPAASAPWATAGLVLAMLPLVEAGRLRPQALRWDGARWHVGPVSEGSAAARTGQLRVVADLGSWMLLRFVAERGAPAARRGGRTVWIPVQRRGLEGCWHAVRCTVYSPPPAGPPRDAAARPAE